MSLEDMFRERDEKERQQYVQEQTKQNRPTTGWGWLDLSLGSGAARGKEMFYDADDMRSLRDRREDASKGLDSQELSALRTDARNQIKGQRSQYLRNFAGNAGRAGIGGARAVAMKSAADQGYQKNAADMERKLIADNAALKRQGLNDLQDFYFRQKLGALGTEALYGQLSSAANTALNQASASEDGGGGGVCCFIFLEARYGNGTMDEVVRKFRDERLTQKNRRGYYKLSEVLVPLMRRHKLVKFMVRAFMTDPLVAYGKAYYKKGSRCGFVFKPLVNFWLSTFDYLGGDHPFIRENGEIV